MRNLLMLSAAFAVLATAASAADLTQEPAPAIEPVATAFDWTGFYAGVHAGANFFKGDYDVPVVTTSFSEDDTGFIGGLQAGYNFQADHLVFGVQTDFAYSSAKISEDFGPDAAGEAKLDWLGTTTLRLGYAFDNLLLYGKGGVAYGRQKIDTPAGDDSKWQVGWTAGAGMEYAFNRNVTGFLEYDYVDLGSKTFLTDEFPGGIDSSVTTQIAKVGVNYKF